MPEQRSAPDFPPPDPEALAVRDAQAALAEDLGPGDLLEGLAGTEPLRARIDSRSRCVLAGTAWCEAALAATCGGLDWQCSWAAKEGSGVEKGATVAVVTAPAGPLLAAERTMLNFLQLLSGTATAARELVEAAGGIPVYDTRKTLPGLRFAQKHACEVGGMSRNRSGLYDAAIVKDNHIAAAGSIRAALEFARERCDEGLIQVEVADTAQLEEALEFGAKRVMLDNFTAEGAAEAVKLAGGRAEVEASGGIGPDNAEAYAKAGVDCISSGLPTRRPAEADFSLVIEG